MAMERVSRHLQKPLLGRGGFERQNLKPHAHKGKKCTISAGKLQVICRLLVQNRLRAASQKISLEPACAHGSCPGCHTRRSYLSGPQYRPLGAPRPLISWRRFRCLFEPATSQAAITRFTFSYRNPIDFTQGNMETSILFE